MSLHICLYRDQLQDGARKRLKEWDLCGPVKMLLPGSHLRRPAVVSGTTIAFKSLQAVLSYPS